MTPSTAAGKALLADVETYRVFSTSGRAKGVNLLDPWEAIRRRLAGPEGILAIEAEARREPLALDAETLAHMLDHHYDQGHMTDDDGVAEDFLDCAEEMLNWLEAASEDAAANAAYLAALPEQEVEGV